MCLALPGLAACGAEAPRTAAEVLAPLPLSEPPPWPDLSQAQRDEAARLRVPASFENELRMRFVLVPAGTFQMGSPEREPSREEHETPHEVTLSRPFYVQTTEVTNAQLRRWRPDHVGFPFESHPVHQDAQPAVYVSWEDATAFASWLSAEDEARTYRLPTEAEWEYACRAGTSTAYAWGNEVDDGWRYANGNDSETTELFWQHEHKPCWPGDDGFRVGAPVGSYPPNGWGLHDMHGNVGEWCADWYDAYPSEAVTDPPGPPVAVPEDGRRVVRGGSWRWGPGRLRSAVRSGMWPEVDGAPHIGFRLVVPMPPGSP